jgi:hypothetical protein
MLKKLRTGSFYGTTALRREVAGLVFVDSVYREERHIPKHEHTRAFFNLVLEGAYTEVCGATTRTRGPSTLALHPPGEVHADHWHGERVRVFHVELSLSRLEQVRAYSPVLDSPADFQGGLSKELQGLDSAIFCRTVARFERERLLIKVLRAPAGSRRLQSFLLATPRGVEVVRDFADSVATLSRTRLIPVGPSADRVPD